MSRSAGVSPSFELLSWVALACAATAGIGVVMRLWTRPAAKLRQRRRNSSRERLEAALQGASARRKPESVRREVLYLASHLHGCRTIAAVFNRWHGSKTTVGKTWVAEFVRAHAQEIERLRRERKARPPRQIAPRRSWALDLSYLSEEGGGRVPVLGILDEGSRNALTLTRLPSKCAFVILGHVLIAIGRFGVPTSLRTDNEAMFTGALWRSALRALAIVHRRGPPAQPWRNGRVERFFATMKGALARQLQMGGADEGLSLFARFYNERRPHQGLGGITPAEAWCGLTMRQVQARHAQGLIAREVPQFDPPE